MYYLFFLLVIVASETSQEWVVDTEYGHVRGFWSDEYNVWRFMGMPYASATQRYKAPVSPTPWSGVLNATDESIICIQRGGFSGWEQHHVGTEDCLVINVFAPQSARTEGPLPVLFFAHGGGFRFNSGNNYNPHLTTRHNVVLVTFNYRLLAYGYLCLGTERVPGNAALWDHVAALRWTNMNIAKFGGDPNKVTIYGESAGAVNTETLILSRATDGLIHQAILESGGATAPWSFSWNRLALAKATAINANFQHADDLDRLADFYEYSSIDDINRHSAAVEASQALHIPCVEREIYGVEAIIKDTPIRLLQSGNYKQIPIMLAYADLDGILHANTLFFPNMVDIENNFANYLPRDLHFSSEAKRNEVAARVKAFYLGDGPVTEDLIGGFIDFVTDDKFYFAMYRSAMYRSSNQGSQVYLMEFSYRGGFNQPNPLPDQFDGAGHADIVAYVMDLGRYDNDTIAEDQIVRDRMTELWTNFVKYGDPTPKETDSLPVRWLPFEPSQQHYLHMDREMEIREFPARERTEFWHQIYDRHYASPPMFDNGSNCPNTTLFISVGLLVLSFSLSM